MLNEVRHLKQYKKADGRQVSLMKTDESPKGRDGRTAHEKVKKEEDSDEF